VHYKIALVGATLLAAGMSSPATAQDRLYTEANVTNVSYIRIKPGMFDKYVKYLDGDYKKIMESAKKDGVIVDYGVYTTPEQHEGDYNMVLVVIYKNMAALDGLRDKMEPLQKQANSLSPEPAAQASIERGAMRETVGSRLFRQILLK
jgi:hypothetical protein